MMRMNTDAVATLPVYPLAGAFPMFDPEAAASLAASVAVSGVREPLVVYAGQLLDGRNRLAAAISAQAQCVPVTYFEGTDEEADQYVLDLNVNRRHLSARQKVWASLAFADIEEERAKARQAATQFGALSTKEADTGATGETAKILAERFNVSNTYISVALAMRRDTTGLGERLLNDLRSGPRSMDDIAKEWRGRKTARADQRREEYVPPPPPAVADEMMADMEARRALAKAEIEEAIGRPLPSVLPDPSTVSPDEWDRLVDDLPDEAWDETIQRLPGPPREDVGTEVERATGEALRQVVALDSYIRSHGLTDHDVLDLPGKAHTIAGVMERLSQWLSMSAEAIRLNA